MSTGSTGRPRRRVMEKDDSHSAINNFTWPPRECADVVDLASEGPPDTAAALSPRSSSSGAGVPAGERRAKSPPDTSAAVRSPTAEASAPFLITFAKRLRSRRALPYLALVAVGGVAVTEGAFLLRARASASPPVGRTRALPDRAVGTTGETATARAGGQALATDALNSSGRLTIRTEPEGAAVIVDGERRGAAPVTLTDISAGDHEVIVATRHGQLRQQVHVTARESVAVVVPLAAVPVTAGRAAPHPAGGFLVVKAPLELQIMEDGRLLGTSTMPRLSLARGAHTLTLTNDALGFREERSVSVSPGKTAILAIDRPTQRVAVNAVPWAEVWADGQRVGETPLGTLDLALGPHTLVFRHPDLGEKTLRVVVRGDVPARVSVDMTK